MTRPWLVAASCAVLAACASPETVTSWEGRPVDSLIFAWGPPMQDATLGDGRRVLSYSERFDSDASTLYCNAVFRADASGQIVETSYDGNLGGCARLLTSKPAAK